MTATGVVEFDPETREVNNKTVTQFTMVVAGQQKLRVTIWPELKVPAGLIKKGLLAGIRGKYSTNSSQDGATQYHNLSAYSVGIGSEVFTKEDAPVVRKDSASAEPAF